jgi:hypothetical protein
MNGFIFASSVNTPDKADATTVFRPCAEAFKRIHNVPQSILYFDHNDSGAATRQQVLNRLRTTPCEDPDGFDFIAYFGHGSPSSLPSAEFRMADVQDLAQAIVATSKHEVRVILYACSAGALPTSFASALSHALNMTDAAVFGHTTSGHAAANPHVTTFSIGNPCRYVVAPGSSHWSAWRSALQAAKYRERRATETLWARFPFMSEDAIRAELGSSVVGAGGRWR